MASSTTRSPGGRRREEAIGVVLDLAAAGSPDRITTARISEAMGLSSGALFRHFPGKDALWEATMDWVTARLSERFDRCETQEASALEVLRGMFDAHLQFIRTHPGVPRLIFAELQRADDSPAKRVVHRFLGIHAQRLAAWIRRGQTVGEIPPKLDPQATATLFIGSIQGLVMQSLLAGDPGTLKTAAPEIRSLIFDRLLTKS